MVRVLAVAWDSSQLPELAAFAQAVGGTAYALVGSASSVDEHSYRVFERVYVADASTPEQLASLTLRLLEDKGADIVASVATKNNTSVLALVAGAKKMVMLTEAFNVEIAGGRVKAKRRVLGGRAEAVYSAGLPVAVTIARGVYQPSQSLEKGAPVERLEPGEARTRLLGAEPKKVGGAIDLESAEVVVGVGRGFRKKEDLALAEELARLLGGVVGASRPVVADYGWLSEELWIGISGRKIKPKLYIAIGISGAPQHMAAAMDSKVIVAINKDKNAPVFQYADYGVVADLYKFLPVLIEKLRKRLGRK